jgi:hypothetical protein
MAVSLTTPRLARSSSPTVPFSACPAHTPLSKTVKPSVLFAQSIILYARYSFKVAYLRSIGLSHLTLPPIFSIAIPLKPKVALHRSLPSMTPTPTTLIFVSLAVRVTPTYLPLPLKLSPRSSLCVFLGYSSNHKGYRCLDLHSNRIIISRHVTFDESVFPFSNMSTSASDPSTLDFLSNDDDYAIFSKV